MKKILVLFSILFGATLALFADDHTLTKLWSEYDNAVSADKPRVALAAVDKIVAQAEKDHLAWDFYDAWNKKVNLASSIDWKQYQSASDAREQAFKSFDEPIINILSSGRYYDVSLVLEAKDRLLPRHNPGFYGDDKFCTNDYEYLLWTKLGNKEAVRELRSFWGAVMDMYDEQFTYSRKLDTLNRKVSSQEEYMALRDECKAFEKRRAALSGHDAQVAEHFNNAKQTLECLNMDCFSLNTDEKQITVYFRNTPEVEIFIKDSKEEKTLFRQRVQNPRCSYYVMDSAKVEIPVLDDGSYVALAVRGRKEERCIMPRHSISLAFVSDAEGSKVYAADYKTGEPLAKYDVSLYDKKGTLVASTANFVQKGGFSVLPKNLSAKVNSGYSIECRFRENGRLRLSDKVNIWSSGVREIKANTANELNGWALLNTRAAHRGDTIRFKTIAYTGMYAGQMSCVRVGKALKAYLYDPEGKKIDVKTLTTDQWGSVAGEFPIPMNVKGGSLCVRVYDEKYCLTSEYFTVDDFILPDFDCEFEKIQEQYFPGDTVCVKGCVKAYSGHAFNAAGAFWQLDDGEKHDVKIAPDGSFSIMVPIPDKKSWYWRQTLKLYVNSSTGQTLEFYKDVPRGEERLELEPVNSTSCQTSSGRSYSVVRDDAASFRVETFNAEQVSQKTKVLFRVFRDGKELSRSEYVTPGEVSVNLPGEGGEYVVKFSTAHNESEYHIIKLKKDALALDADLESLFIPEDETSSIAFTLGAAKGTVWAVCTLYGDGMKVLWSSLQKIDGKRLENGSVRNFSIPWQSSWGMSAALNILYFKDSRMQTFRHTFNRRTEKESPLKISVERLCDKALPGAQYTFSLTTNFPSQGVVSIFDKSLDAIADNSWGIIPRPYPGISTPSIYAKHGTMGGMSRGRMMTKGSMIMEEEAIPFQLAKSASRNSVNAVADDGMVLSQGSEAFAAAAQVAVRSDFATAIAWKPFIVCDGKNEAKVSFRTSDKTGTFVVNVFAHDKTMRSAAERREFVVALPVQVDVAAPKILSAGDKYILKATVSSLGEMVKGKVVLLGGAAGDSFKEVTVPAAGLVAVEFPVNVPSGIDNLEMKVVFVEAAGKYSDAVAVQVPVRSADQVLTEAHSAVLLAGADRQALLDSLRSSFVNTTSLGAEYDEITIADMLRALMKPHTDVNVSDINVLDLTDSICVNTLLGRISGTEVDNSVLKNALAAFANPDGGFAWFRGMDSSPIITATILERHARVGGLLTDGQITAAIGFLDRNLSEGKWPYRSYACWRPGLSLAQWLHVRSYYAYIPFAMPEGISKKAAKEFAKDVKDYLLPSGARGLNGRVFDKTLRLSTLNRLSASADGLKFLAALGVTATESKLKKSIAGDVASLAQYAVHHTSGGTYYPNLVMTFRGLLCSEAYSHSLLCDLMATCGRGDIADGIRLWLMIQKETQKWDVNFAFVNALASIMDGSPDLMQTRVLSISKTFQKPYASLKAAGNGFTISREFRVTGADGKSATLAEGDALKAGDKITVIYKIWSAENRSFVRVRVPREGCLWPEKQLSGHYWSNFSSGYRCVRADASEYYFETFPEETTEIREEMFVNQSGTFTAPVPEVESLYAPGYRANSAFNFAICAN